MANPRIFIIEDDPNDYLKIARCLEYYEVEYMPSKDNAFEFSKLLRDFASKGRSEDLEKIRNHILNFHPDYIFLDVALVKRNLADLTGIKIRDEIIEKEELLANTRVVFLTNSDASRVRLRDDDEFIPKKAGGVDLFEHIKEVFDRFGIVLKDVILPEESSLSKFARNWEYYVQRPVEVVLDKVIRLTFYFLLGIFSIGATSLLVFYSFQTRDPVRIAEYCFISFLPLLITFGLYVFYERSLKQFVNRVNSDEDKNNYEEASQLIGLTKKLFISSLISYLLIRFIVLVTEREDSISVGKSNSMLDYLYRVNPLYQLILIGSCIVVLIGYYFLLNREKH